MSTIQLRTKIPGAKSRALAARRETAVPRGLSHATPVYVARAQDAWLDDVDGNRFIDFAGGIGCINTGKFPKKTLLLNSGAEAVENAFKIARAHTGRPAVIAFEDAFHGRTMMTLAL